MSITATQTFTRAIASATFTSSFTFQRPIGTFTASFGGFQTFTRPLVVSPDLTLRLLDAPTGLAGTLTVQIVTFDGSLVIMPSTTVGISEEPPLSGIYAITVVKPPLGHYTVIWNNNGVISRGDLLVEDELGLGGDTVAHTMGGDRWADGTVVNVYPAAAWPETAPVPSGVPVTSGTVAGGRVTFFGLAERVRYVAFAEGVGVRFMARPHIDVAITSASPGQERMDVIGAKLTTVGSTILGAGTDEATTRSQADAVISARLDQLEAQAATGVDTTRLDALEASVAALQALVAQGSAGAVWQ